MAGGSQLGGKRQARGRGGGRAGGRFEEEVEGDGVRGAESQGRGRRGGMKPFEV